MAGSGGFAYAVFGGLGLVVIALLLLARSYPGSGAEILDWKPTRSAQLEAELEQGDIEQMLDAQNERRRIRGAPERTLEELERDVTRDLVRYRDAQRLLSESESGHGASAWPES